MVSILEIMALGMEKKEGILISIFGSFLGLCGMG